MTDNEIIKALECCINEDNDLMACGNNDCAFMDYKLEGDRECHYYMMKSVLDLINRQKAEVERLKNSGIRANKEFAERLKNEFHEYRKQYKEVANFDGAAAMLIAKRGVDIILKEMVGEDNAE